MLVKREILIRNILIVLLTASLTVGGAAIFANTGNSIAFWGYLIVSVLILAAACVWLAKGTCQAADLSLIHI